MIKSLKPLLLTSCWVFLFTAVKGQEPTYIHYEVQDGLPSSEVYQSIQDDQGYMWFGTDQGLVRWNGYEFKVFTTQDGLLSNVVFGFYKDFASRIWFYTYFGGIGYLQEGKIFIPSYNNELKELIGSRVISSLLVGRGGTIWLGIKSNSNFIKVDTEGCIEEQSMEKPYHSFYVYAIAKNEILYGFGNRVISKDNMLLLKKGRNAQYLKFPPLGSEMKRHFTAVDGKEALFLATNDRLIKIEDNQLKQVDTLEGNATMSLYEDKRQNVWVGLEHKGAIRYPEGDLSKEPNHYLKEHSISSIYIDNEGGIWFTTLNAGIFYAKNLDVTSKQYRNNTTSESITNLAVHESKIWIGTKNGSLFSQDLNFAAAYELEQQNLGEFLALNNWNNKLYVSALDIKKGTSTQNPSIEFIPTKEKTWFVDPNEPPKIFIFQGLKKPSTYPNTLPHLKGKRGECTLVWKDKLFIGTSHGLYYMESLDDEDWTNYPLPYRLWIKEVVAKDSTLYIASMEHGLLIHNDHKTLVVNELSGLLSNNLKCMSVQDPYNLWVGTKKGINHIRLDENFAVKNIRSITTAEGLASNEVNDILYHDEYIWAATMEGLSNFNVKENFYNSTAPPIYLTQLVVNGNDVDYKSQDRFKHQMKNFYFQFEGISHLAEANTNFRYRLQGFDTDWQQTQEREVRYSLSPGTYTFEVKAQNLSGVLSEKAAVYEFEILAPFWKRWWFLTSMILSVLLIGFGLIQRRIYFLKKEMTQKVQLAHFHHQALSAQLKPHFVFNVINSIHNYIRKNDKEKSSHYLVLFSKLIRQILYNSEKALVSIEQELSLLEKYLAIEQLRCKKRLTYTIEIGAEVETKQQRIPTQLIQPFLENAIWHGIMPKEESGHILLNIQQKEEHLICLIEDNGVGRIAAQKNRKMDHKSSGMAINRQRLDLIEAIYKKTANFHIEDLMNEQGDALGTRVHLIIPIIE